jgi:HSP20 family protein
MNAMHSDEADHMLAPLATIPAGQRRTGDADWFPPVDILEDAHEYLFKIDLPEVKPDAINVFVEEDKLVISGERPPAPLDERQCLRIERPYGHFERRFVLPEDASREAIEPLFSECVLELHVQKVSTSIEAPPPANPVPRLRLAHRPEVPAQQA